MESKSDLGDCPQLLKPPVGPRPADRCCRLEWRTSRPTSRPSRQAVLKIIKKRKVSYGALPFIWTVAYLGVNPRTTQTTWELRPCLFDLQLFKGALWWWQGPTLSATALLSVWHQPLLSNVGLQPMFPFQILKNLSHCWVYYYIPSSHANRSLEEIIIARHQSRRRRKLGSVEKKNRPTCLQKDFDGLLDGRRRKDESVEHGPTVDHLQDSDENGVLKNTMLGIIKAKDVTRAKN